MASDRLGIRRISRRAPVAGVGNANFSIGLASIIISRDGILSQSFPKRALAGKISLTANCRENGNNNEGAARRRGSVSHRRLAFW